MSKLVPIDYDKMIKALNGIGYAVNSQRGSHIVMRFVDKQKYLSLFGCRKNEVWWLFPHINRLEKGMLRTIIKEVDISVEEFNKLL